MSSMGNNGNNLDTMLSVRHDLGKNDITGHALLTIQRFIESLDYKPILQSNLKFGANNIKHGKYKSCLEAEPTTIAIKDLITVYKWSYQLCHMATFLPIFTDIIKDGQVLLEDVPQFDKLMYRVMGE